MSEKTEMYTVKYDSSFVQVLEKRIAELEATIAELRKANEIALAEAYRCGYEAALLEVSDER